MEKIAGDDDTITKQQQQQKGEKMKAIRCAKAAILLSSLRNASSSANNNISHLQIEEEIEMEMEKLKLKLMMKKLVKEERNLRRLIGVGMRMFLLGLTILVLLNSLSP